MIFKKHISILLTIFLLVSNLGLAFNVHYCDDEIASIVINAAPTAEQKVDECCRIVEKDSKCCNDKIIKGEIKSDQIIVKILSFDACFLPVTYEWKPVSFVSKINFKKRDNHTYYCNANAPPLYLLYNQYTFYA